MTGEARDWRAEYFDRVRPVVGDRLERRRLAVWGLDSGYLAAEALARTGLRHQIWLDSGLPSGSLLRSLGRTAAEHPSRAAALEHACRRHNELETDWDLGELPQEVGVLREVLAGPDAPHLLVAAGDRRAGAVARAAVDAGVPFVMAFVPARGAGCVQVVWLPEAAVAHDQVVQACEALASLEPLDLDRAENHVDGLEARSLSLALARWVLLRADAPARMDLEQPLVMQGRCIVVRGQPDWPWNTRFVGPGTGLDGLLERLGCARPRYRPPLALAGEQRLLVLGLGTASLFCLEAPLLTRRMLLVDAKPVSPFNPVRQAYGTRHVGQPKAEALAGILAERVAPAGAWQVSQDGPIRQLACAGWSFGAVNLHLSEADPAAEERFAALLDAFRPTLAVVGMGRTHDDNFLATLELRRRGIRHITPSAFPGVTHYKHIVTDGIHGPCYDCLQGHLALDTGPGPTLTEAERELFYGGTQPATVAETYPSAHSLLRLAVDLSLPGPARPPYLLAELAAERTCFVGANRVEQSADGQWLYGVDRPFSMVTYGPEDLLAGTGAERPCSCGRVNRG